jgi:hypothetical protein
MSELLPQRGREREKKGKTHSLEFIKRLKNYLK